MGKHGAMNPIGLHKSMGADNAPSQPTQAELDHTVKMNAWWLESFKNVFMPSVTPLFKAATDAECKRLNELIVHMHREMAFLHTEIAILSEVLRRSMPPDQYQRRMQSVRDELDININYESSLYDIGDSDDSNTEAKAADETPSVFTIVTKRKSDNVETKETKTWLQRMMGK